MWKRRTPLRLGLVALLALAGSVAIGPMAHAKDSLLIASDPGPRQEVIAQPGWVTLGFSRVVDKDVVKIVVLDESGKNVAVNDLIYMGSSVMTQLDGNVKQGTYTVMWRVDRKDGQVEGGAYQFAWGPGHWKDLPNASWSGNSAQPSALASASTGPTPTSTPSWSVTLVPSESLASETAIAEDTPSATPAPAGTSEMPGWVWWAAGGGAVVVVAAVVVFLVVRRRTPRSRGRHAA